ncbi:MAG: hypothetical protein ACE15C_07005 [Phycisphaerae bacterium]
MSDQRCDELFEAMVESVGVKAFAAAIGVTARQVHRMLSGAQANPLARFCDAMGACTRQAAEAVLSDLCRRQGVYWIRVPESLKAANLNAVKESAEAIVAITEGRSIQTEVNEIRQAIAALSALERVLDRKETPKV